MKKCLVTTVAAGVVLYFGGFVIYGLLLMDYMANDASMEVPLMWAIPLAQLFAGAVVATVLSWRGADNFADGAKGAALVGLLINICYGLMIYGTLDLGTTMGQLAIDAVATVVLWGLAGGVVGVVRGRMG